MMPNMARQAITAAAIAPVLLPFDESGLEVAVAVAVGAVLDVEVKVRVLVVRVLDERLLVVVLVPVEVDVEVGVVVDVASCVVLVMISLDDVVVTALVVGCAVDAGAVVLDINPPRPTSLKMPPIMSPIVMLIISPCRPWPGSRTRKHRGATAGKIHHISLSLMLSNRNRRVES